MSDEHREDKDLQASDRHHAEPVNPGDGLPPLAATAASITPETPPDGREEADHPDPPPDEQAAGARRPFDFGFIRDIPVHISVELGRRKLAIKDVLALGRGSAVVLSNLEGEALEIRANDRLIAKGEVLVENDKYGIRIKEIITSRERLDQLMR